MENGCQQRDARRFAGACRFVFNKALALQEQNYKNGGKFIRYEEMARHLIAWKNDPQTSWLKQAPSQALQHALKNLDAAYQRFFDRIADHPTFRKRGKHDSFTIANVRRDFLHKASTAISKHHALVCIEDLKVAHMSRSAKGSKARPGKNVKAKSGLNRSILDQGWSAFEL